MAKCTLLLVLLLVLGCALTSSGKSIKTENTGAKSCGESSASLNRSSFRRVSCSCEFYNQTLMHIALEMQNGVIGITLNSDWFMDPLVKGHNPHSMQALVGNRLPNFTKEQSTMLKVRTYAANVPRQNDAKPNYKTDALVNQSVEYNGVPIGPLGASDWLHVYPRGIRDLLLYTKRRYDNPLIYITENGYDDPNDPNIPIEESPANKKRIDYLDRHIYYIHKAIDRDGVNVMGYFKNGYTVKFGINYINFKNGLKRHPKDSAEWLKKFLKTENHEEL
ncbi:unnamed protein product [Malus baccata var. baccata]